MTDYPITFLTGLPGIGKTKYTEDYIFQHPKLKIGVTSIAHDLLSERENYLVALNLIQGNPVHGMGIKPLCPIFYKGEENEQVTKEENIIHELIIYNVPVGVICSKCEKYKIYPKKQCPYHINKKALQKTKIPLFPSAYLGTKIPKTLEMDELFVDDVPLTDGKYLHYKDLNKWIGRLNKLFEIGEFPCLADYYDLALENVKLLVKQITQKIHAFSNLMLEQNLQHKSEFVQLINQHHPDEIFEWCRLVKVHGKQISFFIPTLFRLFDLSLRGVKITIVGSLPNGEKDKEYINQLIERYFTETHQKPKICYKNMSNNIETTSKIYRINPEFWYPMVGSIKKCKATCDNIKGYVPVILEHLDVLNSTIALITVKGVKPEDLIDLSLNLVGNATYGNNRGSNKLEEADVLILVGTFLLPQQTVIQKYVSTFCRYPKNTKSEKHKNGGYYFLDSELNDFKKKLEEDEMWQSIYRARPSTKNKTVIIFGKEPDAIHKQFKVEYLHVKKIDGEVNVLESKNFEEQFDMYVPDFLLTISRKLAKDFGFTEDRARRKANQLIKDKAPAYIKSKKEAPLTRRRYDYVDRNPSIIRG